jgi:hypothetical protein
MNGRPEVPMGAIDPIEALAQAAIDELDPKLEAQGFKNISYAFGYATPRETIKAVTALLVPYYQQRGIIVRLDFSPMNFDVRARVRLTKGTDRYRFNMAETYRNFR